MQPSISFKNTKENKNHKNEKDDLMSSSSNTYKGSQEREKPTVKSSQIHASSRKKKAVGCLMMLPRFFLSIKTINVSLVVLFLSLSLFLLFAFGVICFFMTIQLRTSESMNSQINDIVSRTRARLSMSMSAVSVMAAHYAKESSKLLDFDYSSDYLYHTLRYLVKSGIDFSFNNLYVGLPKGDITLVGRNYDLKENGDVVVGSYFHSYAWTGINQDQNGNGLFTAKELADVIENEEPTYLPANSLNYSLNNVDPWTANAIKYCDAHWTSAYTTPDYPGYTFLSLTQSICTQETNQTVLGYVAIDETVETVSTFLRKTEFARGASAFFVEIDTGNVVCASLQHMIPLTKDKNGVPIVHTISNTVSPVIRDSSNWIKNFLSGGNLRNIPKGQIIQSFYFVIFPQYIAYYRFSEFPGIDWLIVFNIPFLIMNLEFLIYIPIVLVFIMIVLCLASCIFFCCSMCMFSSLNTTIKQAQRVEIMDLDAKIFKKKKSMFSEINAVQRSFANMVAMLKEFKPFIPIFILQKIQQVNLNNRTISSKKIGFGQVAPLSASGRTTSKGSMGKQSSINVAKQSSSSRMGTNMSRESKTDSADGLFSLGLENNFLTIVHCSITNILAELKKNFDKTELEEQHSKMMELFMNSCTMAGGFPFDVKFDAFSLMIPGHNQAGKAAQFAMRINDKMKDFNKKFIIENRIPLYIHIGIACSDCLCGNVGSSSSKHFAVIGSAVDQSEILANCAKKIFKTDKEQQITLMSSSVFTDLKKNYLCRSIGEWESGSEAFGVFHLMKENDQGTDAEWMYALENEKVISAYQTLDEGFSAVAAGNFDLADEKYSAFVATFESTKPDDLAEFLKKMIDNQEKTVIFKKFVLKQMTE